MTILAATVANANRDPNATPVTPDDFLPDWAAALDDDDEEVPAGGDH